VTQVAAVAVAAPTMCRVTDFTVDRLWPDPAPGLDLDQALAGYAPPPAPAGRIPVATNMVTSLDGRAQLAGTAEGLSGRADRRLMRLYRVAFDAVGSGAGTLRKTDFWSSLPDDLAARRRGEGRAPQPLAVVIAGNAPVPLDRRWYTFDQPRLLIVGRASPHATEGAAGLPDGTDLLVAPSDRPEPAWVLERLGERGIGSLLLEGGPTTNAAFLAAGCLDELCWTLGARVLAADALTLFATPPGGSPFATQPREARLVSVLRSEDELFLRYRFGPAAASG
jgi:riboflavin biosynthesis pyrimidine reductase